MGDLELQLYDITNGYISISISISRKYIGKRPCIYSTNPLSDARKIRIGN